MKSEAEERFPNDGRRWSTIAGDCRCRELLSELLMKWTAEWRLTRKTAEEDNKMRAAYQVDILAGCGFELIDDANDLHTWAPTKRSSDFPELLVHQRTWRTLELLRTCWVHLVTNCRWFNLNCWRFNRAFRWSLAVAALWTPLGQLVETNDLWLFTAIHLGIHLGILFGIHYVERSISVGMLAQTARRHNKREQSKQIEVPFKDAKGAAKSSAWTSKRVACEFGVVTSSALDAVLDHHKTHFEWRLCAVERTSDQWARRIRENKQN